MAKRSPIEQIAEYKKRRGLATGSEASYAIEVLQQQWKSSAIPDHVRDFVPIRLVTELEVFARAWIGQLIDHGLPYAENAQLLVRDTNLKFDYAISRALLGQTLTVGDLISHNVSINSVEQIISNFTKIVGHDFLPSIASVHDRAKVEIYGEPIKPIIADVDKMCAVLAKLFTVRHILIHEKPRETPYIHSEVGEFIEAALSLVRATMERFLTLLYGRYPLTQADMNVNAGQRSEAAKLELAKLVSEITPLVGTLFSDAQQAWETFSKQQALAESGLGTAGAGSMAPMIYNGVIAVLTHERISYLSQYKELLQSR